jgi:acetyltransferase-like isoleucine patch superfamily enzyme
MITRLKRKYWRLIGEYKEALDLIVRMLPGETGIGCRRRYFRKRVAACGHSLRVVHNVRILNPAHLHLGNRVELAWDVFIEAAGTVRIGNTVAIGPGTKIWSNNHRFENPDVPIVEQGLEMLPVDIEDDVWIGADCIIKPGVRIGKGSVISAGTILSKSIPEYAVVAGNPGRVVSWRRPPQQEGAKPSPAGAEVGQS